jgi:hypothetical protein
MLAKNSSRVTAESSPDHFVTNDIKDKSLCTVGVPIDNHSLKRCLSLFATARSDWILESVIAKFQRRRNFKTNFRL